MKIKAHNFLEKILFYSLLVVMCFCFTTCGLDVYYILYPPSEAKVVDENSDALGRYFSFKTADVENSRMDIYIGVTVIYRIYNDLTKLVSDSFSINNYNTEYSEKGYNRAIALGYQQLGISNKDFPFVSKSYTNRSVEIRLFTEGFIENPYEAGVKISGQYIKDGFFNAIPLRENENTFAFYSSSKNTNVNGHNYVNAIPSQEDIDVNYIQKNDASQNNVWYVNAFAVSVGMTPDFSYKYSELEPLGYITISEAFFDN